MNLLTQLKLPADIKNLNHEQLRELARDIRQLMLDTVLKNGGHLASNLGMVELTLAMHYVFSPPQDTFIFDVGHQAYTHKILTGRMDNFATLRTLGGISGFPKPTESTYDSSIAGHASIAPSLSTGFAKANQLNGSTDTVVSVIGDGAMTGGLAYEAMNTASQISARQVIIINDNEMSIAKNTGSVTDYLVSLSHTGKYRKLKNNLKNVFGTASLPAKIKNTAKYYLKGGSPFEHYGGTYFGVVDGHNFSELIRALEHAKSTEGLSIVHVATQKGKGYLPAEQNPSYYHGYSGEQKSQAQSYSKIAGNMLLELAKTNPNIVAITAAMAEGCGLEEFEKAYPERFSDVGIAESHAVTHAVGLALGGKKPYFAVYSTFLQRAYDQLLHDVCLNDVPVTLLIDRAGLVPADGITHQGIFDVGYLLSVPGLKILSPATQKELEEAIRFSENYNHPLAIRYPKGNPELEYELVGKITDWQVVTTSKSPKITVLTYGAMVAECIKSAQNLPVDVINCRCLSNIDTDMLKNIKTPVLLVEDSYKNSGFANIILQYFTTSNTTIKPEILNITEKGFLNLKNTQGNVEELRKILELDYISIKNHLTKYA